MTSLLAATRIHIKIIYQCFLSIIKQNFFLYLRLARHTAKVKNFPQVNEDPKESLLREFQNKIMRLKALLPEACKGSSGEIRIGHTETRTHDGTDTISAHGGNTHGSNTQ